MNKIKYMLVFGLILFMLTVPLWAKEPLPEVLLNAKKICMVNQTSDSKQFEALRDELMAWARWELVTDKEEADLIFTFFTESKTSSQTMQSCLYCPPTEALSEKEFNKITITGKDGTVYLAAEKEKNNRASAQTQAQKLLGPLRKRLEHKE